MKQLSEREDKVVKAILTLINGFDNSDMNYSINCLIENDFSYFISEDIQQLTSLTKSQMNKAIGSLLKKKILTEDTEGVYYIANPATLFNYYEGKIWETF